VSFLDKGLTAPVVPTCIWYMEKSSVNNFGVNYPSNVIAGGDGRLLAFRCG